MDCGIRYTRRAAAARDARVAAAQEHSRQTTFVSPVNKARPGGSRTFGIAIKQERGQELARLEAELQTAYFARLAGMRLRVLTESPVEGSYDVVDYVSAQPIGSKVNLACPPRGFIDSLSSGTRRPPCMRCTTNVIGSNRRSR